MYEIQPLRKAHDRQEFDCGVHDLNQYIQRFARQNQDKDVGRTFVAIDEDSLRVWGYYTVSAASVEFDEYPESARLPQYPIPAILLGRLAVDKQTQGKGLGPDLLIHALKLARSHAESLAVRAVVVEAIDERAQRFYQRYGFEPLKKQGRHLYLTMAKIRKLP